MELGRVVGQVISTVRGPGLANQTLLLVNIEDELGNVLSAGQVAVDTIGAGEGELVLLVRGSSAQITTAEKRPLDLSVVGIIDQITSEKKSIYSK